MAGKAGRSGRPSAGASKKKHTVSARLNDAEVSAFRARVAARASELRGDGIVLTDSEYLRGLILRDLDAHGVALAHAEQPAPVTKAKRVKG
jgi:hypothetical protein